MTRTNIANVIEEDIGSTSTQGDDSNDHNITDCREKIVDDTNSSSDKNTKLSQLSYTEITQIATDITNMYNKATPQMKTIVASMLFRTRDVLAYDAPSSSLHNFDSNEELLKTANEMVNMQKMAFVQSKEFNPESLSTDSALKPNKSLVCKRPHDRLVSTREHVLKKEKTQKTCRFCHSVLPKPHGKNTCPLRLQYRHDAREISKQDDKSDLRRRMETEMPIRHPVKDKVITEMSLRTIQNVRHFVIHKCFAVRKSLNDIYSYLPLTDMNFEVSFIDKNGKIPTAQRKQLISGYVMDNLLGAFKNTEARMIYDGTVRETYQDEAVICRSRP